MKCDNCGLVIPIYPGRYPYKCPQCGYKFDAAVDQVVEMLLSGEVSSYQSIEEQQDELGDRKKLTIDMVMQKVNIASLLDQMVGITISGESDNIFVYFSDSATEDKLKDLVSDIKPMASDVQLYPSKIVGANWCISILNTRIKEEPSVSGVMDVQTGLEGEVDVM